MKPIVTFNAGSSSLKFAVFDGALIPLAVGQAEGNGPDALCAVLSEIESRGINLRDCRGIGHRLVHGGTKFIAPVRVNDAVQSELQSLCPLAPVHLPFGLNVLEDMRRLTPNVPHVACFDTAFHATQPDVAMRLPLPRSYHDRGYRRYGFHGLSYEHVVKALPKQSGRELPSRLLVAHLGNGASMCAVLNGKSIATTMGFSTADGLVMGSRTGSIDPGVLIALMRDDHMDHDALEDLLYRKSGLLGLSGITSDMRELIASHDARAAEAIDHYCYHAARHAGSLVTALGGIDAIVFTGGIGENAVEVRQKIMAHLNWLSIKAAQVFVVKANEELAIAGHVASLLHE